MNNLKAKLKKQGGFTLIEMLIVVAIIAILVAISIPLVNQALERARESTDAANERSFKAVLLISYLNGKVETAGGGTSEFKIHTPGAGVGSPDRGVYVYDAANGTIVIGSAGVTTYGKSTRVKGVDDIDRKGMLLVGYIDSNGKASMQWFTPGEAGLADSAFNKNLICPELIKDT